MLTIVSGMEIWLKIATAFEYGILILLFALSIWSFAIMIDRRRTLRCEQNDGELGRVREALEKRDLSFVRGWTESHPGLHAGVLKVALASASDLRGEAGDAGKIDRAVRSFVTNERMRLEKGFPVLATLGANAPFIGLFGTVLGIIRAFAALSDNSGAAASVMSGISQALVATAAGLFVAIPAVIAFNAFSSRVRNLISQSDSLKDLLVANVVTDLVANSSQREKN